MYLTSSNVAQAFSSELLSAQQLADLLSAFHSTFEYLYSFQVDSGEHQPEKKGLYVRETSLVFRDRTTPIMLMLSLTERVDVPQLVSESPVTKEDVKFSRLWLIRSWAPYNMQHTVAHEDHLAALERAHAPLRNPNVHIGVSTPITVNGPESAHIHGCEMWAEGKKQPLSIGELLELAEMAVGVYRLFSLPSFETAYFDHMAPQKWGSEVCASFWGTFPFQALKGTVRAGVHADRKEIFSFS